MEKSQMTDHDVPNLLRVLKTNKRVYSQKK